MWASIKRTSVPSINLLRDNSIFLWSVNLPSRIISHISTSSSDNGLSRRDIYEYNSYPNLALIDS